MTEDDSFDEEEAFKYLAGTEIDRGVALLLHKKIIAKNIPRVLNTISHCFRMLRCAFRYVSKPGPGLRRKQSQKAAVSVSVSVSVSVPRARTPPIGKESHSDGGRSWAPGKSMMVTADPMQKIEGCLQYLRANAYKFDRSPLTWKACTLNPTSTSCGSECSQVLRRDARTKSSCAGPRQGQCN